MTLHTTAAECIEQFGYTLLKSSTDSNDFRFYLHVAEWQRFRAQLIIDQESLTLDLRVYCTDELFPVSKFDHVVELSNRVNEDVPFGLFYTQVGSGAIIFKLAYDARKGATVEDIEQWMSLCAFPIKVFKTALDKIIHDGTDAEAAYGASLIENQIYSGKVLKKVRRAVLKLEKGGKDESLVLDDETDENLAIVMRELGMLP